MGTGGIDPVNDHRKPDRGGIQSGTCTPKTRINPEISKNVATSTQSFTYEGGAGVLLERAPKRKTATHRVNKAESAKGNRRGRKLASWARRLPILLGNMEIGTNICQT